MRAVALIETGNTDIDTVILWNDQGRLVAIAYEAGRTKMTRPLDAVSLDDGVAEVRTAFQIDTGMLSRITHWTPRLEAPFPPLPDRWTLA